MPWLAILSDQADLPDFPSVALNPDGKMEVMLMDNSPGVIFCEEGWQDDGTVKNIPSLHPPILTSNKDTKGNITHLEFFYQPFENAIKHAYVDSNGNWSANHWLGKGSWEKNGFDGITSARLAAGNNTDGRLQVFALVIHYQPTAESSIVIPFPPLPREVWTISQNRGSSNDNGWGSWVNIGRPPCGDISGLAVASDQKSRLGLFGIGSDGELWSTQQRLQNDGFTNNWFSLGKYSVALTGTPAVTLGSVTTAANAGPQPTQTITDESRFVFANGIDGLIYFTFESRNAPDVNLQVLLPGQGNRNTIAFPDQNWLRWVGWFVLSVPPDNPTVSLFGAATSITGNICVFAQTATDIWMLPLDANNLPTQPWQSLGAGLVRENNFHNPVVFKDKAGLLQLFCVSNTIVGGAITGSALWTRGEDNTGTWT